MIGAINTESSGVGGPLVSADSTLDRTRLGILRTLQARLENTQFLEHSMRCTQAVLAELICVELKEMGRATLNKHVYSFVFLT